MTSRPNELFLANTTTRIKNNPSLQLVLTRTPTPPQCKVEGVTDVWFSRWPFASTLYLGVWGSTSNGKLGLISRRVERGDVKKQPCIGACFKFRTSNVTETVSALNCGQLTMSNVIKKKIKTFLISRSYYKLALVRMNENM